MPKNLSLTKMWLKLFSGHIARQACWFLLSDDHHKLYPFSKLPRIVVMSPSSSKPPLIMSDRVRRLIYQASYTGMKETDVLLGHFAKTHLADLCDADLTDFENLLAAGDHWIYAWVTGNESVPAAYDTSVFRLIKNFKDNK